MAKTRSLSVVISGDEKDLSRAFHAAGKSAGDLEKKTKHHALGISKAMVGAAADAWWRSWRVRFGAAQAASAESSNIFPLHPSGSSGGTDKLHPYLLPHKTPSVKKPPGSKLTPYVVPKKGGPLARGVAFAPTPLPASQASAPTPTPPAVATSRSRSSRRSGFRLAARRARPTRWLRSRWPSPVATRASSTASALPACGRSTRPSRAPKDPLTNARQAVRKFRESGYAPWEAYTGPDGKGSDGPWRQFASGGGSGGSSFGGSSGGSRVSARRPRPRIRQGLVGKPKGSLGGLAPATLGQELADVEVAKSAAAAHDSLPAMIAALQKEKDLKTRRLKVVTRALKHRQGRDARQRLTEERAQLIADLAGIGDVLKEYRADLGGGATTITGAEGLDAGLTPEQVAAADPANAPTATDYLDAATAQAALTPGTEDDIQAATNAQEFWRGELDAAVASGDPRRIATAAGNFKSAIDALGALTAAVVDEAENRKRLVDELAGLRAEVKMQNEIASSVAGISSREALKAFADSISGQIYGRTGSRRQTAGNGTAVLIP